MSNNNTEPNMVFLVMRGGTLGFVGSKVEEPTNIFKIRNAAALAYSEDNSEILLSMGHTPVGEIGAEDDTVTCIPMDNVEYYVEFVVDTQHNRLAKRYEDFFDAARGSKSEVD